MRGTIYHFKERLDKKLACFLLFNSNYFDRVGGQTLIGEGFAKVQNGDAHCSDIWPCAYTAGRHSKTEAQLSV